MSEESWLKVSIIESRVEEDILSAWLNLYNVDSIHFDENQTDIYIKKEQRSEVIDLLTRQLGLNANQISVEEFENRNWNALWESNFQPVEINKLYLRANFHDPAPEGYEEIIILPKMAFGTGHHDTTFLMMSKIDELEFDGKSVLDYGCGTGILSILPLRRNCLHLTAIDIQPEAVENTIEHFEANNCPSDLYTVYEGDLDRVSGSTYDIILANINRHVLIENAFKLFEQCKAGGMVLCSGILKEDSALMEDTFQKAGFHIENIQSKGEWLLITLQKP